MAITDKDIEKLKQHFATKNDLKRVEDKLDDFKGEVLTRFDKVMGELERAREDRVFAKAKDDEQDKRLDKIEAKVG